MKQPAVDDTLTISKAPASKRSLKEMKIPAALAGSKIVITQSSDFGVAFKVPPATQEYDKEYHLSHAHSKNIFPDSYAQTKIKNR